jgi:hypothetical protein
MEGQLAAWRGLEPSLDTAKHCKGKMEDKLEK